MTATETSSVEIYLDSDPRPLGQYRPPARFELDTGALPDGPHVLRIVATDRSGHRGVREIPFRVRNGPGIAVDGLRDHDVVQGTITILVNAYGGAHEVEWEPARAETPAPIPTWAWVALLGVVAWAMFYVVREWRPPPEFASSPTFATWAPGAAAAALPAPSDLGGTLYRTTCANCHQQNGEGVPGAFPPLAGDPLATSVDPVPHIQVVLFGLSGKTINGARYAASMPTWAAQLSDGEVAAVINHERTSWGNHAPTIAPVDVARIRAAYRQAGSQ